MSFSIWAESKMRRLRWYDMSWIKVSTAAFVLMIAKLWPPLLGLEWHWYAVIAVLTAVPPLTAMFGGGSEHDSKTEYDTK